MNIIVWHGRAYLPTLARLASGAWMTLEPVYITDLSVEELLSAAKKVLAEGHKNLPNPTREEMQRRKDPVLTATKARNWKELTKVGASYSIDWTDKEIQITMSRLDKKGRWEWDPEKMRSFPLDTPLQEIVGVILEDIQSRPKVW